MTNKQIKHFLSGKNKFGIIYKYDYEKDIFAPVVEIELYNYFDLLGFYNIVMLERGVTWKLYWLNGFPAFPYYTSREEAEMTRRNVLLKRKKEIEEELGKINTEIDN